MTRLSSSVLALLVSLGIGLPVCGAEEPTAPAEAEGALPAGHSVHGEAFNEGPRQRAYLMAGTGTVSFPVTAASKEAQAFIEQGVGQLHGFWYLEAERSFRQAAALEPECAMAYWGMAMANVNNEKRAKEFIAEAVKRKGKVSERERLYIEALDAFYKKPKDKKKERGEEYAKALEKLLYKYPDDIEAKAFLGLQLWKNRTDGSTITSYLAVDALLKQVLAVEPMHPCHHYVIHLWDYEKPELALESAARCGPAAPAIAHMWHMPGHIYSRLKRYDDACWQQEASARVDHAHMMRDRLLPDQIHNFAHNNEWLIRNLNFVGRVHDAVDLAKNMLSLPRHPEYNTLEKQGSAHYGRLRLFETLDRYELWDELIRLAESEVLEPTDKPAEQVKRLRYLGRAYFRSGNVAKGTALLTELEERLRPIREERDAAVAKAEAEKRDEFARRDEREARETGGSAADDEVAVAESVAEAAARADAVEQATKRRAEEEKQLAKAKEEADRPFKVKMEPLEKAIDELRGHLDLAEGRTKDALEQLKKAGGLDDGFLAFVQHQAGETDAAIKKLKEAVKRRTNEVQPRGHLVRLLWEAGRRDEAKTAFEELRKIAGSADLDVPVFARLTPIASELGYPSDWRIPREVPKDIGARPDLDGLGPFRWSPPEAPEWTLVDAEGHERTLAEYRGKPVLVIFYLGFGCLHCVEQLQAFGPKTAEFKEAGIEIVAVSTDSRELLKQSHENYGKGAFPFPLASDAKLDVFQAYRCFDDFEREPLHGTFLIDAAGRVRWQDIGHEPFMDPAFVLKEAQRLLTKVNMPEPTVPAGRAAE